MPAEQQEGKIFGGKWRLGIVFDSNQYNDYSVPAKITRISISGNKGKDNGLEELIKLNRTSKAIETIKLSYIASKTEDLETVLTRGTIEIISKKPVEKQRIPGYQRRIFRVLDGKPAKLLKQLVGSGDIYGTVIVTIRISEITFEDGSIWRDKEGVSLRRDAPTQKNDDVFRKTSYRAPCGCLPSYALLQPA